MLLEHAYIAANQLNQARCHRPPKSTPSQYSKRTGYFVILMKYSKPLTIRAATQRLRAANT
ncbi:hypothetical protein [Caballeronia sp. SL2Y3]|uniref:hypothetical protein n=1 Tax=Caballeronia sp. SL2Y3 TaxID=2878151 RepID=UPI001FD405EA|nr:hypothetical protein [Caballeronia sp. SL2Y3]